MRIFYLFFTLYSTVFSYLSAQNFYDSLGNEVFIQACESCTSNKEETFKYYFDNKLLLSYTCANKAYNGVYTRYYENGIKAEEVTYKNNKRHGAYYLFYPTGEPYIISSYKKGNKHGNTKIYNSLGTLIEITAFKKNRRNGRSTIYYDNGSIHKNILYKNDRQEGYTIVYDKMGEITSKEKYKNDMVSGHSKFTFDEYGEQIRVVNTSPSASFKREMKRINYYLSPTFIEKMKKMSINELEHIDREEDSNKKYTVIRREFYDLSLNGDYTTTITTYKGNKKDGIYLEYNKDIIIYKFYKNDLLHGKSVEYSNEYSNLNLLVENYKRDLLHGKVKEYEEGQLMESISYRKDEEHGISKLYYESGYIEAKVYSRRGTEKRGVEYNEQDKVKDNLWFKIRTALPFFMPSEY